jgi:hypothetical protein
MTRSDSVFRLECDFDAFLFASIGEGRNGMPLSVLSALARLDFDPWLEAANLARLPGNRAVERLAALIATLPDSSFARLDPGPIAARLIGLLPRRVAASPQPPTLVKSAVGARSRVIAICAFVLVGLLVAQWATTGLLPPGSTVGAKAPISREDAP